jgi:hypothetical protein
VVTNSFSRWQHIHGLQSSVSENCFVKARELRHDAALYHLYRQEIGRIEHTGGRVPRVILDFELKQSINRKLAKLNSLSRAEQVHERRRIAHGHGLRVVNGKIPHADPRSIQSVNPLMQRCGK